MWVAVKLKDVNKPFTNLIYYTVNFNGEKMTWTTASYNLQRLWGLIIWELELWLLLSEGRRVADGMGHMERLLEVTGGYCLFWMGDDYKGIGLKRAH